MLRKKHKFIYWLIGLGCGIALSGMAMAFIGLSISQEEELRPISEAFSKDEDYILEREEEIKDKNAKEKNIKEETNEVTLKETAYKWVEIPLDYGATEISRLLEQEDIIDNQEKFLEYLREHKQTKNLRCGSKNLPVNGEYDTILAILTGQLEDPN